MPHHVQVNSTLPVVRLRDVPIGAFFIIARSQGASVLEGDVFVRLWHNEDSEEYHIAMLSNAMRTWQGPKRDRRVEGSPLDWPVRVLERGSTITITVV